MRVIIKTTSLREMRECLNYLYFLNYKWGRISGFFRKRTISGKDIITPNEYLLHYSDDKVFAIDVTRKIISSCPSKPHGISWAQKNIKSGYRWSAPVCYSFKDFKLSNYNFTV